MLLVDEVLYAVSAVSGPVAIIGLAYGCVPLLAPLLSRLAGTDARAVRCGAATGSASRSPSPAMCWCSSSCSRRTSVSRWRPSPAFFAGLLFTLMPVCSARLQQTGLGTWAVLKAQGAVAAILSLPLLAVLSRSG